MSPSPPTAASRDVRLRSMVDSHFDTVWRSLKRLGVPEAGADDATQQVFLVAARRLDEIELGRERPYLLGIALRVASDARRSLQRRREVPMEGHEDRSADSTPRLEEMLDEKRARAILAALLESLPEEMREAFVLFELEEIPAPEVAQMLGIPVGTVASRVRRAREFIRQGLQKRGAT